MDEVNLKEGQHELARGETRIRLAAVGDLMLGTGVGDKIQEHGPRHTFNFVKTIMRNSDIRFANLEWPLTGTARRHPVIRHRPRFAPTRAIEAVSDAGFTVVSVANNHIFDCVDDGLADTLSLLRQHGIDWTGAGASLSAARTPAIQIVNGVRVGFLAYTFPLHQIASEELPGCAPNAPDVMLEDIGRLKDRVDHVIVSIHTGNDAGADFYFYPTLARQQTCRKLIDEGATAILCHHCHVPQGIEVYEGGLIAHGLGSFVTDIHDWFFQRAEPPYIDYVDKSMILHLDFDSSKLLRFSVYPTFTGPDLAVRPMNGEERESYLRFLHSISIPLYDAKTLERRLPRRTMRAKLGRLAIKTRRKGLRSVAAELSSDALGRIDNILFEPRRIRAWKRELRAGPCPFEDHQDVAGDSDISR